MIHGIAGYRIHLEICPAKARELWPRGRLARPELHKQFKPLRAVLRGPGERAETIRRFAAGELLVLCNVSLFGEGFDLSAAAGTDVTIDAVVLLRPTQSLSFYLQMVGRALRPAPGKVAILLDHAGLALRHGLPDDERVWGLTGSGKGPAGADPDGPMPLAPATCSGCFSQIRRPRLSTLCPYCGHSLVEPKELPTHSKEQLRELKRAELEALKRAKEEAKQGKCAAKEAAERAKKADAARRKKEEWDCPSLVELVAIAKRRDYQYPKAWAERRWAQMHPYSRALSRNLLQAES